MDNLDDSEKNAKISDSAYSNSCSNSHSRRSLSSKSTRSGSNSSGSGSSGYCGKPLAYSDNSGQPAEKRIKEKDGKKKKQIHVEQITEDPAESEERPHDEPSVAEEVSDETCNGGSRIHDTIYNPTTSVNDRKGNLPIDQSENEL